MAIALYNSAELCQINGGTGCSASFDAGTGSDRALVVVCSNLSDMSVDSVTFNGTNLTRVLDGDPAGYMPGIEVWVLVNPASGSNTLAVSTTDSGTNDEVKVSAHAYTGVDQTTPINTANEQYQWCNNPNQCTSISLNITTANANSWLLGASAVHSPGTGSSYTEDSNFTSDVSINTGNVWGRQLYTSYRAVTTAQQYTYAPSWADAEEWSAAVCELNEASGAAGVTETLSEAATTGASLAETWSVDYAETASASATTAASTVEAWSLSYSETLAESATTVAATADSWSVEYAETLAEAAATAASMSESYDLGAAYSEALAQSASTAATLAETYGAPDYAETLSESATTAASLTDAYELGQAYQESLAQSAATAAATAEAYTAPGFDETLAEAASTGALMSASYDAPDYSETASEAATTGASTLETFGFLEAIAEQVATAIAAAEAYDAPDYSEAFNAAAAATATTAETFSTPNVLPAIVRLEARLLQGYRIAARLEGYEIAAKL